MFTKIQINFEVADFVLSITLLAVLNKYILNAFLIHGVFYFVALLTTQ